MRIEELVTKWIKVFCIAMLVGPVAYAAPTVSVQDIVTLPDPYVIETMFEGNQGEIFGLVGKSNPNLPFFHTEQRLFKIDSLGQYREILSFANDRVLSSVKGADNRLYLLVEKTDSYKLYRIDIGSTSPQLELAYDFGARELARICPVNNTAPEYISLKPDGTFLVAFRHDAGLPEYLGQCAYGAASLDLFGASPVYKQLYETVPSVSFEYRNTLGVQALFEQQGKFYTLFYKSIGSMFGSFGYFLQEIDSQTNPPQETIVSDSISEGYRGSVSMTVFEGLNNKLYGIKRTGQFGLSGTGNNTSILFEVDPNNNPAYNPLETLTSSISEDENNQFVYSPEYPNALSDFVKADGLGNYFFGTRNTGLTEGKLLFRLDNISSSPVYHEYPDVHIPLQFGNLMLFANNAFYGGKLVSQITPDGNPKYQRTLVKVTVTGVELLPPINTAPVAVADTYKIHYKGKKPVTIAPPGLLKNDSDAEGDKLSVFGIDAGKPRVIRVSGKKGKVGKVEVFNDGRLVFTPPRCKPPRVITFSYQATDGKSSSNSVVVTLNIKTNRKDEK